MESLTMQKYKKLKMLLKEITKTLSINYVTYPSAYR